MSESDLKKIRDNVHRILGELPSGVELVAVAKTVPPEGILAAIEGGAKIIGENYVQEAEKAYPAIGNKILWHFIGRLQKNKVKKAAALFDMIESVDSPEIAAEIDRQCARLGRIMPVLIEVNSGREEQKSGALPENVETLARVIAASANMRLMGLMTIGPREGNPEDSRPYFRETSRLFQNLKQLNLPGTEMKYLSMGMTNSYRVAIEEGANLVRIGTRIFGERNY
jgi:PLP dependent protein